MKKDSNIKVALIATILLDKRAAHRNYMGHDTASNKDINYVALFHLIPWGAFKFGAKNRIGGLPSRNNYSLQTTAHSLT